MKIFLTEFETYGTTFAGPNIIAPTFETAEIAALKNNLVVVGELDSIYIDDSDIEHDNVVNLDDYRNLH
tara:strand:+ start:2187 stop:2393 length:207 start_codon:yes stop_codon:yes gene_type:complete